MLSLKQYRDVKFKWNRWERYEKWADLAKKQAPTVFVGIKLTTVSKSLALRQEIATLLDKDAIEGVDLQTQHGGFYWAYFWFQKTRWVLHYTGLAKANMHVAVTEEDVGSHSSIWRTQDIFMCW